MPGALLTVRCLAALACTALAASAPGCRSWFGAGDPFTAQPGGRWLHAAHGYSIAAPAALGAQPQQDTQDTQTQNTQNWERIDVEGAELAYRLASGATFTMLRDCARGPAKPALLARQLRIGLDGPGLDGTGERLLESEPIELRGDRGWRQVFRAFEGTHRVLVHSVTLRSGACTYDWLFVGAGDPDLDAAFEGWWSSFEPVAARGAQERAS